MDAKGNLILAAFPQNMKLPISQFEFPAIGLGFGECACKGFYLKLSYAHASQLSEPLMLV